MKVFHLVQSADTIIGGSLTVARALVKAQRRLGLDAWLVCLYETSEAAQKSSCGEAEIVCQIPRGERWGSGVRILRRLIQDQKPCILHHHDGILWPRLASVGLGVPRVTHGHLGAPATGWFSQAKLTHLFTLMTTDELVAISPWVADSWIHSGMPARHVSIIPNGVDQTRFYPRSEEKRAHVRGKLGLAAGERMLLWVGRMDLETKGLDRLAELSRWLPRECRLVIAGDGPDRPWLEEKLRENGGAAPPIILGQVSDPAELFGCADIFLFTSRIEPFGLVLLEAACSGLPIYGFECMGGGSELLHELAATTVAESGSQALAAALAAESGAQNAAAMRRRCERYTWENVAQKTSELYQKLAGVSATGGRALERR